MTFAQHQVGWALARLYELNGARWVYDMDSLQEIRRDVMTILTHRPPVVRAPWCPTAACCSNATRARPNDASRCRVTGCHRFAKDHPHVRPDRGGMMRYILALPFLVGIAAAAAQVPPPTAEPEAGRVFCEQTVSFRIADPATVREPYRRFLGAWSDAAWDPNTCAALIVDNVDPDGTASVTYVYGPLGSSARVPGGTLHGTGVVRDGELRFQNSDGTQFAFRPGLVDLVGRMTTPHGQSYEATFKKTP
jgi:hypothetical protein